MPKTSSLAALFLSLYALVGAAFARSQDTATEPLSTFPQSLLAVRTGASRVVHFKIWTADTPRREEQGLMFIQKMDEHSGMLFLFPQNPHPTMWMKNTYLALDLLFIDADGRINYIAPRAAPLSLDIIHSPRPTFAVLELNGGASERFGIQVGDRLLHPSFRPRN